VVVSIYSRASGEEVVSQSSPTFKVTQWRLTSVKLHLSERVRATVKAPVSTNKLFRIAVNNDV